MLKSILRGLWGTFHNYSEENTHTTVADILQLGSVMIALFNQLGSILGWTSENFHLQYYN